MQAQNVRLLVMMLDIISLSDEPRKCGRSERPHRLRQHDKKLSKDWVSKAR